MRHLFFILILTSFLIGSCSAVNQKNEIPVKIEFRKEQIKSISLKGNITTVISGQSVTAYCQMTLVGTDSASMTLFGPLGMLVARLYARPDYFAFYNTITSEAFEGKPTAENLNKILKVSLSFEEFARLVRNEMPDKPENFLQQANKIENDKIVYKNTTKKEYAEFCMFNADLSCLEQYQRKAKDGTIILNIIYQNFKRIADYSFPKSYIFKFPVMDGSVTFEADEIEINQPADKPFAITIPKSFTKYVLD